MKSDRILAASFVVGALALALNTSTSAYGTFSKWNSSAVDYYVNPQNADLSQAAAETAVQAAANVWSSQSRAAFRFTYAGRVSDTSIGNDGRNVVLFRNTTKPDGSAIASTYTWWSGSALVDADIIFWDGGYTLFAGTSGCSSANGYGVFIEDVLAHEFGHALGLSHSGVAGATMYPQYLACSQEQRTLAADDIAGVESLYPPSGPAPVNSAPTVAISSPANGASWVDGTLIRFSGRASDAEEGDVSSRITWRSNLDGEIGVGSEVTSRLSIGTHTITAKVVDSSGAQGSAQVLATVSSSTQPAPAPTPPSPAGISLVATGYKVKGQQHSELRWTGASSAQVDVYRDGSRLMTTANDGLAIDAINRKGGGSYTYNVCEAGTSVCSIGIVVRF